jgi:hypothetical protein
MICVQSLNGRRWKGPSRLANRVFECMPEWLMRDEVSEHVARSP